MLNNDDTSTATTATTGGAPAPALTVEQKLFEREKHIQYFKRLLQMLPQQYSSHDTHRVIMGMYAIGGLELLGVLDETVSEANRKDWIEWIYAQQRIPSTTGEDSDDHDALYGFAGPFSGLPFPENTGNQDKHGCECGLHSTVYDSGHITVTYAALMALVALGDDLSRVAKEPILRTLRRLQLPSGAFIPTTTDYQPDMRFVYCAAVISHILNDWSGINRDTTLEFIRQCQSYDYGFGQNSHEESHGGSTYCAIASLGLMGGEALGDQRTMVRGENEDSAAFEKRKARAGFIDKEATRKWLIMRQTTGFQGRINKPTDTCYSFWVGGSLAILGSIDLVNENCDRGYLMETQHKVLGGFGKWANTFPDAMHSYMGLAGLSLIGEPGLRPMDPLLNTSKRLQERLYTQSVFWKTSA
ncbi:Geranylgeranyl transferase type-1 subunit beta [Podila minutissima]|nr:Geranylgeranyl transferase type-1 subunit beta [Podila minutissima]